MTAFNGLSPEEDERLALLTDEASEVIQAIAKVLRHGWESYNPFDPDATTNRAQLEKEIGHFRNAVQMMVLRNDIDAEKIIRSQHWKRSTVFRYLHDQPEPFMHLFTHAYPVENTGEISIAETVKPKDGHELIGRDYPCDCTVDRSCMICDGGLSHCRLCGGAEATLPSECPKVQMTAEQSEAVMAQLIDYRNGEWVQLGEQKESPPETPPAGLMEQRDNY